MKVALAESWNCRVDLDEEVMFEVRFWKENLRALNKKVLFEDTVPKRLVLIKGDASASGCGSYIEGTELVAAKVFSEEEKGYHSTLRELLTVEFSLKAFKKEIVGANVSVATDSQSAQRILSAGSMKVDCHRVAMRVARFCSNNRIVLDVQWIPREENEFADLLSREAEVLDTDDWGISEAFSGILQGRYGEFTVDLFANDRNRKATRFYSFYHNPGCSGVNAFSHNWGDEFALMVPPVSLVGKALCHLRLCRGKGVLVVPCWPSAYFWPLLVNKFWDYIRDVMKVKGNKVLVQGENKNSLLGSNYFGGFILAILLDCSNA